MPNIIEAHGLGKVFKVPCRPSGAWNALRALVLPETAAKVAIQDISFSVAEGELLALLGPNGAGKSTTIKILTGILTPSSGSARVAGLVPYRDRRQSARNIGVVFGQRSQLWWDLPACESFKILRDIYGVGQAQYRTRMAELDQLLEISSFWDTRVRHLSLGQRVRCDVAAALLHDPPVVFLDEPTIGMDAVAKQQVREMLRHEVEERGRSVLLTTHDMTEVERLARRVVLINDGRLVVDGTLADIRSRFAGTWRITALLSSRELLDRVCPDGLKIVDIRGQQVIFGPDPDAGTITKCMAVRALAERYEMYDMRVEESDLEDIMRLAYTHGQEKKLGVGQSPS